MGGILVPPHKEWNDDCKGHSEVAPSWHEGYEWRVCSVCKEVFTVAKKADGTKCGKVKCEG